MQTKIKDFREFDVNFIRVMFMTISFLTDLSVSQDDRLRNTKTEEIKKIEQTATEKEGCTFIFNLFS